MKLAALILFLFFCCNALAQSKPDTVNWRPGYKLTWADYHGLPETDADYIALTSCSIAYTYHLTDTGLQFKVWSFFYKDLSKANSYLTTPILLEHEQGHFDITELFARKKFLAFKNYHLNRATLGGDLKKISDAVNLERDKMDKLYDKETNFSKNRAKQIEWNKKIKDLLDQYPRE